MTILGVDTSNYTSSLALIGRDGRLLAEERQMLSVPAGSHGLRQSEAVFQHVQILPGLLEKLPPLRDIDAVAVSSRPRDVEGSYMPVFSAGLGFARVLARTLAVPLLTFSHQVNHLGAGLWSLNWWPQSGQSFLALHLSGGTSEVLAVTWQGNPKIELLGGTRDLNAGQFVDRIGVALGLPFPAGFHLEQLAKNAVGNVRLPGSVREGDMSFSGPLTAALRLVGQADPAELARAVEDCIARTVEKALLAAAEKTGLKTVLMVGGVMVNARIRERLQVRLEHRAKGFTLLFPSPAAARDSAIGVAALAQRNITV